MTAAHVIGVVGGSGGVGATVLAAALATRAAATGCTVACVDGDVLGGGLDVTFGLEQEPGLRWPDLAGARGRVDGPELLHRLPATDGVAVLSFDRTRPGAPADEARAEVLRALGSCVDLVVLALPRADAPFGQSLAALADALVLVSGDGVQALAATSAAAVLLGHTHDQLWLCVRCAGHDDQVAESLAAAVDLPLVATLRHDPRLDADLLHGIPPGVRSRGPLARAAETVLAALLLPAERRAS
ncbi:MAG: septum site-determining protein Ssd [Oryzihumus sp.]